MGAEDKEDDREDNDYEEKVKEFLGVVKLVLTASFHHTDQVH